MHWSGCKEADSCARKALRRGFPQKAPLRVPRARNRRVHAPPPQAMRHMPDNTHSSADLPPRDPVRRHSTAAQAPRPPGDAAYAEAPSCNPNRAADHEAETCPYFSSDSGNARGKAPNRPYILSGASSPMRYSPVLMTSRTAQVRLTRAAVPAGSLSSMMRCSK